jgi:hypothetical protein
MAAIWAVLVDDATFETVGAAALKTGATALVAALVTGATALVTGASGLAGAGLEAPDRAHSRVPRTPPFA